MHELERTNSITALNVKKGSSARFVTVFWSKTSPWRPSFHRSRQQLPTCAGAPRTISTDKKSGINEGAASKSQKVAAATDAGTPPISNELSTRISVLEQTEPMIMID